MTYLSIYDKNTSKRITSFVTGVHGETIDELTEKAKAEYPDAIHITQTESEWQEAIAGNYEYRDGKLQAPLPPTQKELDAAEYKQLQTSELAELKQLLADTDYNVTKFMEGVITAEQYEPMKQARTAWRAAYNAIETAKNLKALKKITYSTVIPVIK
nr:MAG TPA: hypothetical protein [Caudoviricetes sp.]